MKNTMIKVWGIVLALAMLAGLFVFAVPTSAANLAWTANGGPTTAAGGILTSTVSTGWVFVVGVDGKTILAYETGTKKLYKSGDAGATFTTATTANGLDGAAVTQMAIAADNLTAVATDGTSIFGSTNAGASWSNITPAGVNVPITSVAVTAGPSILFGANGEYWKYTAAGGFAGGWTKVSGLVPSPHSGTLRDLNPGEQVIGIAFSPNYSTDNLVVLVTTLSGTAYVRYAFGARPIGEQYADKSIMASTATSAMIVFPSDFNSTTNANFLVGLNDAAGLWKVGIGAYTGSITALPAANQLSGLPISSLSFKGTWAAGTAYFTSGTSVYRMAGIAALASTTAAAATLTSTGIVGTPLVAASQTADNTVYVISSGPGGAFFISTDGGATFDATQLIQVGASFTFDKVTMVSDKIMFIVGHDATATKSIFKTLDGGATWTRIQSGGSYNAVYASPAFATDNTVFVTTAGSSTVYKSTDGGQTLLPFVAATTPIAMAVVDANTYYYADAGAIYKSGSFAPLTVPSGAQFNSLLYVNATNIYAGGADGKVYKSVDGATFTQVGTGAVPFGAGVKVIVAANAAGALYAGDSSGTGGVMAYTNGAWAAYGTVTPLPATPKITDLAINSDGTLYAADMGTSPNVYRIADGANWESTGWTGTVDATSEFLVVGKSIGINSSSAIANFADTISAAPVITAPGTGAAALLDAGVATISWNAVTGATGYVWKISTTPDMVSGLMYTSPTVATTSVFLPNVVKLINGQSYYVTVQVVTPYHSTVSAFAPFQTKLTTAGNSLNTVSGLTPAGGSSTTNASPTFQWAAVANATSYEIKVSSKPDFSDTVDSTIGLTNTLYTTPVTLKPGTYYWEIRAVNGTNTSDWIQSAFSVAAPAPTTTGTGPTVTIPAITIPPITVPTPVVNIPTSNVTVINPTPNVTVNPGVTSTPAWVWVMIVIGAVLVIAVIVLIVRTRKM